MSAPAQKASGVEPLITRILTSGSVSASASNSGKRSHMALVIEFFLWGRLITRVATPSAFSKYKVSFTPPRLYNLQTR